MTLTAPNAVASPFTSTQSENLEAAARSAKNAAQRIAPLWPLRNLVAVNPFVGLTDRSFLETAALFERITDGGMLMPLDYYRAEFAKGNILRADLEAAIAKADIASISAMTPDVLIAELETPRPVVGPLVLTLAEQIDQTNGTTWEKNIDASVANFCAGYYDENQSTWRSPWSSEPLYRAWLSYASLDPELEHLGWVGFRAWVADLPSDPNVAIAQLLDRCGLSPEASEDFLHKLLFSIRGWAGRVQYEVREKMLYGESDQSLIDLLAIRLAYDVALIECGGYVLPPNVMEEATANPVGLQNLSLFIWQLAHEQSWQRQLFAALGNGVNGGQPVSTRKTTQAVFCIDVRSEVFRRALESRSAEIETIGFPGFFGVAIEQVPFGKEKGGSRCPALLTPAFRVREGRTVGAVGDEAKALQRKKVADRLSGSWSSFKSAAISSLAFVETAGLAYGPCLIGEAFGMESRSEKRLQLGPVLDSNGHGGCGIAPEARVATALGALTHMGVKMDFARIVLLCGHGSATRNNPYGSGLDCGACGGHAGDANARVAVAILNDPYVRASLAADHGIEIPSDTWFLAGPHNTTTDAVTLFGLAEVPTTHGADLALLRQQLEEAGTCARQERAAGLGLVASDPTLDRRIRTKSQDWSEVRPEWGLAGNAAFVAAPRARTKHANLGGRVLLHNYDHNADVEKKTLELIMVAPMVVANWINLQYFGSTVNQAAFGSGDKVTHNVVGAMGVCQGNGGDLLPGLPLQSVHDGKNWVHEPLRLHVVIEAPREAIDTVMANHRQVHDLVVGGWLLLFAIEEEGAVTYRCLPDGQWLPIA